MNIHTLCGFCCALDQIKENLEFGIFSAKLVSKDIQYHLENLSFSNTQTFALIVLVSQITIIKK